MSLRSAGSEAETLVDTTELRNRVPPDQLFPNYRRLDFQMYKGVMYSRKMWTNDMVTQLEKLKDLPLMDDDVILLGHPRSGNNWALEILNMILTQTIQYSPKHLMYHLIEYNGENVQEVFNKFPSPRCLCSHIHATHLPRQVHEKKLKVVYLLRNPKDTLTSYYKIGKSSSSNTQVKLFSGEFEEFLQATLENKATWNSWFDHVLAMERYQEEHPEVPVYVSLFEDKKLRPVEAIRSLCAFLGKPDTMAEEIAEATSLEIMREQTKSKQEKFNILAFKKGDEGLIRQGNIGNWRHQFTVAQSEAFDKVFEHRMGKSRLAPLVREYL